MKKNKRQLAAFLLALVLAVSELGAVSQVQAATNGEMVTIEDPSEVYTTPETPTVSVHDPSIVVGWVKESVQQIDASTEMKPQRDEEFSKEIYFIFGSHLAFAYSWDLVNWQTFTNNITTDYETLFEKEFTWAALGDSTYKPADNMWAPDVIYNKAMGKWCMYMSINGISWNSSICMLTADSLSGDWSYEGTVIYSGFGTDVQDYTLTDYCEVTGDSELPGRYTNDGSDWYYRYGAHAIDPCVLYDEDGNLWMSYGSWSGGIYILRLDNETGFRDKTVTYTYDTTALTDPYMGKKLGGSTSSGEASYILYIDGYYYLFLSYGALVANGGYNMRVFRSKTIDGGYVDVSGDLATKGGATNGTIGTRLMSYYKWSYWKNAQVAQGHNSAFVDEDGKAYVIYHTRTDDGTEGHFVRVHQLFTTKNGYLVAAPFTYSTTDCVQDAYTAADVAGTYEILFQENTNNDILEYNAPKKAILSEDGSITGDVTGTWSIESGTSYVTMAINGITYEGNLVEQNLEGTDVSTLCFTTVGTNDICLWGYRYPQSAVAVTMTQQNLTLTNKASADLTLPTEGLYGSTITWKSNNAAILSDGSVICGEENCEVVLTATITNGNYVMEKQFPVTVVGSNATEEPWLAASYFTDEPIDLTQKTESVENPLYGLNISNGVTIKLDVLRSSAASDNILKTIFAFDTISDPQDTTAGNRFYLTGSTYFGYNATGGYFDHNFSAYDVAGDDFLTTGTMNHIEIKLTSTGYEFYVDDKLAFSSVTAANGTTKINQGSTLTDYSNVLAFLSNTATYLNFGFGSWWLGAADAKISNFEIWVEPVEQQKLASNYYFYQDYEGSEAANSLWIGTCTQTKATDTVNTSNYIKLVPSGSGNRGAYSTISMEETPSGEYVISTDIAMTSSTGNNGSTTVESQFVIGNVSSASNDGITSDYVLKLAATGKGSQEFTINDSTDTVTIPAGTWVNIKLTMNAADKTKAVLTVTNLATEDVILSGKEITVNGSGNVTGCYFLMGRGNSSYCIDNIKIYMPGVADYEALDAAILLAKKYVKLNEASSIHTEETVSALRSALEAAENLSRSLTEAEQEIIDAAAAALENAIEELETKTYQIVLGTYEHGTVTGDSGTNTYPAGTSVTLTAIPDEGYAAGGWKDAEGNVVCQKAYYTFMVDSDMTLYPIFVSKSEEQPGGDQNETQEAQQPGGDQNETQEAQQPGGNQNETQETQSSEMQNVAPVESPSETQSSQTEKPIEVGDIVPVKKVTYKITGVGKSASVEIVSVNSTSISYNVAATVSIDGVDYKITSIGNQAFYKNTRLKKLTIGKNVKSIGTKAFYGCKNLTVVTFKSGSVLQTIEANAFNGCKALTKLTLPSKKLKTIGKQAFKGCSKLKSITISSQKLKTVGKNAFKGIKANAVIKVPSTKVGAYQKTFAKAGLGKKVKIKK